MPAVCRKLRVDHITHIHIIHLSHDGWHAATHVLAHSMPLMRPILRQVVASYLSLKHGYWQVLQNARAILIGYMISASV